MLNLKTFNIDVPFIGTQNPEFCIVKQTNGLAPLERTKTKKQE